MNTRPRPRGRSPGSRTCGGRHRRAALLLVVLVASMSAGCRRIAETSADPERARAVLESALSAWRDGETCDALRRRTPPVHVADECWLRGARLESFDVGPSRPFGPRTCFDVTLVGPPPLGRRTVVYTVSTHPAVSLTRSD